MGMMGKEFVMFCMERPDGATDARTVELSEPLECLSTQFGHKKIEDPLTYNPFTFHDNPDFVIRLRTGTPQQIVSIEEMQNVTWSPKDGKKLSFKDSGADRRYIDKSKTVALFFIMGEGICERHEGVQLFAVYTAICAKGNLTEKMGWMVGSELLTEIKKAKASKRFDDVVTLNFAFVDSGDKCYIREIVTGGIHLLHTKTFGTPDDYLDRWANKVASNYVQADNSADVWKAMRASVDKIAAQKQAQTQAGQQEEQGHAGTLERLDALKIHRQIENKDKPKKVSISQQDLALYTFNENGDTRIIRMVRPFDEAVVQKCFKLQTIPGNTMFNLSNASRLPGLKNVQYKGDKGFKRFGRYYYKDICKNIRNISKNKRLTWLYILGYFGPEGKENYIIYRADIASYGVKETIEVHGIYGFMRILHEAEREMRDYIPTDAKLVNARVTSDVENDRWVLLLESNVKEIKPGSLVSLG